MHDWHLQQHTLYTQWMGACCALRTAHLVYTIALRREQPQRRHTMVTFGLAARMVYGSGFALVSHTAYSWSIALPWCIQGLDGLAGLKHEARNPGSASYLAAPSLERCHQTLQCHQQTAVHGLLECMCAQGVPPIIVDVEQVHQHTDACAQQQGDQGEEPLAAA